MYILGDLKAANITPNEDTYARIIITFLAVQGPEYDHAFLYLEEMKKAGYIPRAGVYATFVKKCVYHNDDRAWAVVEEMKRCGYRTKELEDYIQNAEKNDARDPRMRRNEVKMKAYVRRKEVQQTEEMFRQMDSGKALSAGELVDGGNEYRTGARDPEQMGLQITDANTQRGDVRGEPNGEMGSGKEYEKKIMRAEQTLLEDRLKGTI